MVDWPIDLSSLGNTVDSVFSSKNILSAAGSAGQAAFGAGADASQNKQTSALNREFMLENRLRSGMPGGGIQNNNVSDENRKNAPGQSKPAVTDDPSEVEAKWTARLAKYAGIAQATGVKLGGL